MSTLDRPTRRSPLPGHVVRVDAAPHLLAAVRQTLVRRDRLRLADAVCALLDLVHAPAAWGQAPTLADQVAVARPVLRDIDHLLRGDGPLDPRGVGRVGELVSDARSGRLAPCDPLAVDAAAREARRLLLVHRA